MAFAIAALPVLSVQAQTVWYVDGDSTPGNGCTTWADACPELQSALDLALAGDQVWVAAGTYLPDFDVGTGTHTGDRAATFLLSDGVAIYGGFDGTEATLQERAGLFDQTILSGDLNGDDGPQLLPEFAACFSGQNVPLEPGCEAFDFDADDDVDFDDLDDFLVSNNYGENSFHVTTGSGTDATAILDGFTIAAGNAAPNGGGMFNTNFSSPTVTNCTFSGNSASLFGGGMYNSSFPTVTNCTFSGNMAGAVGGGMYNNFSSSSTVTNCTFSGNSAGRFGGGMHNDGLNPTVTNCTFSGNTAGERGGGMAIFSSNPTVTNCTFSGNTANENGGGMYNFGGSDPTVTNCTFSGNTALQNGGGMYNTNSSNPTVTNCILWGNGSPNGPEIYIEELSILFVTFSDIQGGEALVFVEPGGTLNWGDGNLDADPLFVDADGPDDIPGTPDDDLRVSAGSPAIDAAHNSDVPLCVLDRDGNERFVDDPATADCQQAPGQCGTPPIVDMGAYEFGSQPLSDCNGNSLEDMCELTEVITPDCNGNDIPDECDITAGTSQDCNANGIPDECDLAVLFTQQQVISTAANGARSVFAADLDGDGDTDVLSASFGDDKIAWYENTDGLGSFGPQQVISTVADGARSVFAADVDGDGDTDVLSASVSDDKIAWYENTDGLGSFGPQLVISTVADGARSVFAADVDGDGDTDILAASQNNTGIVWYENDGGSPPSFTERVIATAFSDAWSVFATDVDGDGDTDVLSASANLDTIAWYENDGGSPPSFTTHVISTTANGANSVFATDVDGDGDTDVLSASSNDDTIAWYENIGGSPPTFTEHVISTIADNAFSVFATDLDGDGDTDVLSASIGDDKIAWYENVGGSPLTFVQRVISTNANGAVSVFATDVDGDGDTDVLSASLLDDKIAWYENTTSSDCNENGIPDECDLDCGLQEGPCDVPGCGLKIDCNGNGVPDECEVPPLGPPEGDCNANGVPDECEVPQAGPVTSTWVGGSGLWDTPPLNINWCLPETPDNNVDADFDVIIDGASSSVTLNISPTISELELSTQAMVFVGDAGGANSRTLAVDGTITNDGVLRATDRERFVLDAPVIDQIDTNPDCAIRMGGVLEATDGVFNDPANPDVPTDKSILEINGARVIGGFARATDPNSEIHLIGGAELVNVCVEGVVVPDGQVGGFSGTVTNDGVLAVGLDPESPLTALLTPSDVGGILQGNGGGDDRVRLGGQTTALLGNFKSSFTNAANHIIDGAGIIFGGMANLGTVHANDAAGDLIVLPPGDKVNDGLFLATDGGTLRVEGEVTGSGSYAAEGGTIEILAPVSGFSFTASGGTIRFGSDTQGTSGDGDGPVVVEPGAIAPGEIIVTGSALTGGSSWSVGNDQTEAGMSAAMRLLDGSLGVVNGPVLVTQNGTLEISDSELIAEDLILEDGATLIVGSSISLDGTLFLELTDPAGWNWTGDAMFEMAGGVGLSACNSAGYAELEVGGQDVGGDPAGFESNFDLAELVIGPDAHVSLVDNVDNGPGAPEALYVDTLTFTDADARLNLNGLNLYYVTLNGSENQIIDVLPVEGDMDGDGVCDSNDICPGGDDSIDDDGDGVPNFCDNCPDHSNPDQADCDLDGEGDVCELAGGTSEDCDGDGVPDECQVEFDAFAWIGPDGGSFTDPVNWNPQGVPGGEAELINATAQDNRSVLSVAGETTICLLTIESTGGGVQTLEIGAESALKSTGGAALNGGGEIQLLGGALHGSAVVLDGGALVGYGSVSADVDNSGRIEGSANGDLVLAGDVFSNAPAGTLRAPLGSLVNVQAASVTQSGLIEIESAAGLVVAQPLINEAGATISILGGAIAADGITNSLDGAINGFGTIQTDLINDGVVSVVADMQIVGHVVNDGTIIIQSGVLTITGNLSGSGEIIGDFKGFAPGGGGLTVIGNYGATSSATLLLGEAVLKAGGNFDIAIDDFSRFDLTLATLQMVGLPATTQSLESLAEDVGGDVALPSTALFSLATLRVGPLATTVQVVDNHDNDGLGQEICEALYVENLIIESGATLNTNGCRVYYSALTLDGSVDEPANLIEIGSPCPADLDGDGAVNAFDLAILLGSWGSHEPCPPFHAADFDEDCGVDATDLAQLLGSWGLCE